MEFILLISYFIYDYIDEGNYKYIQTRRLCLGKPPDKQFSVLSLTADLASAEEN